MMIPLGEPNGMMVQLAIAAIVFTCMFAVALICVLRKKKPVQ